VTVRRNDERQRGGSPYGKKRSDAEIAPWGHHKKHQYFWCFLYGAKEILKSGVL